MTHKPSDPLRVGIYARQSVEEPMGIVQQLDDCREEARRRGWRVVDEYPDDDTSGSRERSPQSQWHRMLKDFDAGLFDVLVVTETSRLTRALTDVLKVRPPKRDMRIVAIREGVDTVGGDDFLLKQLVLLAEREVWLKTIRARRYAVARRKEGHPPAGRTAYGYRWVHAPNRDDRGTRFRIDEGEATVVRQIFNEFLAGAPLGQIARDLNTDGHRTREGSPWRSPTIRRILINPHYAALLPPTQPAGQNDLAKIAIEDCTAGAWAPVIELDQLLAARGLLVGRQPNHQGTARKHLLSGLAECGVCGGPVRSARASTHPTARIDGSGTAPRRYHSVYRCIQGHFVRKGAMIEEFVKEVCIERLSRPDARDLLTPPDDGPDLAVLHSRRTELEARDGAIASLMVKGKLSPVGAEQALDELADELRSVNEQIALAVKTDPIAAIVGSDDVRAWWDDETTTLARRRAVIETLMTIVIHPVGSGRRVTTLEAAAETIDVRWRRLRGRPYNEGRDQDE
ncbi:site-specific recombinase, DNA invertase Pin [Brachybacterium faecium DSM 4810]|uniref:Site-specific recombinase, DNA invertase Pin n=1 Tax=Brachybacterium faecium (strain ATCC 43885 / DSM 4810 / JCM 11609 / LMG 19847 / NBRC 14762 / NCIMB 9860 / 6-10) TaxID=446465 RepID=C7MGE8_BRAFD|nr:recombinase family protein [Brachybacterium faecium]ACU86381.1 site-specific recombinase, DNA invertase Pin [Brachybacterium faecium DSM 4810]